MLKPNPNPDNTLPGKKKSLIKEIYGDENVNPIDAELETSIQEMDKKIKTIDDLLAKLGQADQEIRGLIDKVQTKKELSRVAMEKLEELFKHGRMKAFFAGHGINQLSDLRDLIVTNQIPDELLEYEEIRNIAIPLNAGRLARQEVDDHGRGDIKRKIRKFLAQEGVNTGKTWQEIISSLQKLREDLNNKKEDYFYQTTQGRERLGSEINMAIQKQHKSPENKVLFDYEVGNKQIDDLTAVSPGDFQSIKHNSRFTEVGYYQALQKYYANRLAVNKDRTMEEKGITGFQRDLQVIDSLPKKWLAVNKKIAEVEKTEQEFIATIMRTVQDMDPKTQIAWYEKISTNVSQHFKGYIKNEADLKSDKPAKLLRYFLDGKTDKHYYTC